MKALRIAAGEIAEVVGAASVPAPRGGSGTGLDGRICAADLEFLGGYMGFAGIPGHGCVGVMGGRRPLIDAVLALGDGVAGYRRAAEPGAGKVLLDCR